MLTRADAVKVEEYQWGRLEWMVSGAIGNSEQMTVGRCYINPGAHNHRHIHPNCDEVLHVLQGRILHSFDDRTFEMGPGDTVSIPLGTAHNARNLGDDEAIFVIAFSTPERLTIDA